MKSGAAHDKSGDAGMRHEESIYRSDEAAASNDPRVPTIDGKRIRVQELNLGTAEHFRQHSRLMRFFHNLSLFLAGMYVGQKCSGTPKPYHRFSHDQADPPV